MGETRLDRETGWNARSGLNVYRDLFGNPEDGAGKGQPVLAVMTQIVGEQGLAQQRGGKNVQISQGLPGLGHPRRTPGRRVILGAWIAG